MNYMSLIFQIQRVSQGGLCFVLNHLVGHYLYAKQNNLIFTLADDEWLFKHTLGFKDYFDSIETHTSDKLYKEPIIVMRTGDDRLSTTRFTVKEYQEAFSYVIRLNKYMEEKKQNIMKDLGLVEGNYDAIMIRRGDKIFFESYYIDTVDYVLKLVERKTNTIFVQTDDYDAYLEVVEEAKKIDSNIKVITTCPPTQMGTVNHKGMQQRLDICIKNKDNNIVIQEKNLAYCQDKVTKMNKSVCEYSPEEVRAHGEESIIGLEICSLSRHLCMDLQSNINRYLFLKHNNIDNIIIVNPKQPNAYPCVIPKLDTLIQYPAWDFHTYLSKDLEYLGPTL